MFRGNIIMYSIVPKLRIVAKLWVSQYMLEPVDNLPTNRDSIDDGH